MKFSTVVLGITAIRAVRQVRERETGRLQRDRDNKTITEIKILLTNREKHVYVRQTQRLI